MGQSISRASHGDRTSPSVGEHHESTSNDHAETIPQIASRGSRPSRSKAVRRGLSTFLKPCSPQSLRSRVDSAGATAFRRSWRKSMRWSKAPPNSEQAESSQESSTPGPIEIKGTPSHLDSDGPDSSGSSSTPYITDAPSDHDVDTLTPNEHEAVRTLNPLPEGNRLEKSVTDTLVELPPDTVEPEFAITHDGNAPMTQGNQTPPVEFHQGNGAILQTSLVEESGESAAEPSSVNSPPNPVDREIENNPVAFDTQLTDLEQAPAFETPVVVDSPVIPVPPPSRQFPPPGTLVVVQGVVHTTDVPRASTMDVPPTRRASSAPRPSTPSENRSGSRLSALLQPRPSSMGTFQSPQGTDENPNSNTFHPSETDDTRSDSNINSQALYRPHPEPPTLVPSNSGPISSNSIEVLGTLLSVAAAATAASLLTGSTENTSMTPNAGLDGMFGPGPGPGDSVHGQGRADRMRQAWSGIRERLGLRASGSSTSGGRLLRPDGTPMDAREMMLAEMTRAFNLGLGLNNDSDATGHSATSPVPREGDSNDDQATTTDTTSLNANQQQPPEGSFERFLVDLQADLRVALTRDPSAAVGQDDIQGNDTVAANTSTTTNASSAPGASSEGLRPLSRQSNQDHNVSVLENISDSESDEDDDDDLEESDESAESDLPPLVPNRRADPIFATDHPVPAPGNDDLWSPNNPADDRRPNNPARNINWWRLYRFPPIDAPRPQGSTDQTSTTPYATSPTAASSQAASPPISHSPLVNPSSPLVNPSASTIHLPTPASPSLPSREAALNIVYPIIVVGLQSVNMSRQHTQTPSSPQESGFNGNGQAGGEDEDLDPEPNRPSENENLNGFERPGTPRGRPWRSRAADAFRNLRPGRRGISREEPAENGGSRTFLIYVIGGYYPPDHSIVTGGSDNLGSFEALLELAELLGQVKPPTVSKEDIDKSGLEIIKSTELERYEKESRISSNCTERCLICLDDYEPQEDIRILACRHGFHKNCVDKWLQTGRNNCPACRSKGVATDGPSRLSTEV